MEKHRFIPILVVLVLLLSSGCGPSAEEIATMTASAWTPTPTSTATPSPTPTPTPIPYDLTITIQDGDGNPISGAMIILPESGSDDPVASDTDGKYSWMNLSGEGEIANFSVSVQGYHPVDESTELTRGLNEFTITMERDPLAILPSEACQPGQDVLYIEDFQDNKFQFWNDINRPMWEYEVVPERGTVLTYTAGNERVHSYYSGDKIFGNSVWHIDISHAGDLIFFLHAGEGVQYFIRFGIVEGLAIVHQVNDQHFASSFRGIKPPLGVWQHVDIAYFDGSVEFWLDDTLLLALDDPDPIKEGVMGLGIWNLDAPNSFDNIVVCSLSEPFVPTEKPQD